MSTPTVDELRAAVEDADALIAFLRTLDPDQGIDTIDQDNCFYCKYLASRFPDTYPHANLVAISLRTLGVEIKVEEGSLPDRLQRRWMESGFETNYRRGQTTVFLFPPEAIEVVETVVFDMKAEEKP